MLDKIKKLADYCLNKYAWLLSLVLRINFVRLDKEKYTRKVVRRFYRDNADEMCGKALENSLSSVLTDEQKHLIDEDPLKKLTDAEEKLGHKILLGDANGDGVVDISDVTAIQMHVAELKVLEGDQLTAADVNLDGSVAIDDASILQVFLAETEVAYPIGQWI